MSDALTILHASDLQCGSPYLPRAADALVRFASGLAPDCIVISGDLTQRAKAREFATARGLIDRLPRVPVIVTPGNHDVPVYRVWERLLAPYRRWRAGISPELDTVTRVDGATFVALNSTAPLRAVVGGRIDRWQVELAREAFAACAPGDARVLVIHHHFVRTPDGTGGRTLPNAVELVRSFESMKVDFVLGGHVHRIHIRTSRDVAPEGAGEIPLIACGTTTSRRGRGPEEGVNSLNVVRVLSRAVEVHPYKLGPAADAFAPMDPVVLPRRSMTRLAGRAGRP